MNIFSIHRQAFLIPVFLLAGTHMALVQAANEGYSDQPSPQQFASDADRYPPPPPGGWQGVTDSIDRQLQEQEAGREQMQGTQARGYRQQPQRAPRYGGPGYDNRGYDNRRYSNQGGYGAPQYRPPAYGGRRDHRRDRDSGPWDSHDMPWSGRSGRGGWMDKDSFSDAWDDMLNAPSDMGSMPGGWQAPSVSMPNPVDVGDEFGTAAEDLPDQMRNVYDENRDYNSYDRYDRYDRRGYDRGGYDRGGYDRYRR